MPEVVAKAYPDIYGDEVYPASATKPRPWA